MPPETSLKVVPVTMSDICIDVIKTQEAALKSLGILINISKKDSAPVAGVPSCYSPSCGGTLGANISRCQIILDNATEIARHLSSMAGRIG